MAGVSFSKEAGGEWPSIGGDNLSMQYPFECQRQTFDCSDRALHRPPRSLVEKENPEHSFPFYCCVQRRCVYQNRYE